MAERGPTAFQSDAFQLDAFQIGEVSPVGPQPLPYPYPFDRTPHGVPIATAAFSRRGSLGGSRVFRRRGRGEDQDQTTPTRE